MRLVSFSTRQGIHFGVVVGNKVVDLVDNSRASGVMKSSAPRSVLELLQLGEKGLEAAHRTAMRSLHAGDSVRLLKDLNLAAPITRPGKLLALAGNYGEHLKESGHEWAEKAVTTPRLFMKPSTTATGPFSPIVYPKNGNHIDWEGELGVVIGKTARFVKAKNGMEHIAGFLVINDVSERAVKIESGRKDRDGDKWFDWILGKWFDTFAPMGPAFVTKDEIADVHALHLQTRVNGEVKQDGSTGQMIFNVAELVEWASRWMTLEPGDIISTGTPSGVGAASGTFLKPGDVVEVEIEQLGTIKNKVVKG
jgi:2-keto-4-pentenoate hydratase/2-oxohepta-3-ene-1,7-dioic acid hydratase in catechol pathway